MAETLLKGSGVVLIGRPMDDITVVDSIYNNNDGNLNHLKEQMKTGASKKDIRLARIYAFAFGGMMTQLSEPAIFLVHGDGRPALERDSSGNLPTRRGSARPGSTDITGVAAQDYTFTEDMCAWEYDKNDLSLRLDLSTGTLEDILMMPEMGDDLEYSPDGGGKVGGGRVGGGRVGGGRVGGGRVGGGRVGGGRIGG